MLFSTAALALAVFVLPAQCISVLCNFDLYGQPDQGDSIALASRLPFAKLDPDDEADKPRIFAEPAFFQPRFSELQNTWPSSMVQLPLIWRFKSARLALLFYATSAGIVLSPSVNGNWKSVQAAAEGILKYCVGAAQHGGGVWIIVDNYRNPLLVLYLYASESPFEDIVNKYMITGQGINPFNTRGLGTEGGVALNATEVGAMLSGVINAIAAEEGSIPTASVMLSAAEVSALLGGITIS